MSATDIATSVDVDLDLIYEQTKAIAEELINTAAMKPGQILVVGCSSVRSLPTRSVATPAVKSDRLSSPPFPM